MLEVGIQFVVEVKAFCAVLPKKIVQLLLLVVPTGLAALIYQAIWVICIPGVMP